MSDSLKGLFDRIDSPTKAISASLSAVVCAAALTAITKSVLRSRKKTAITEDFERVAAKVGESSGLGDTYATYDFIIVGGGTAGCVLASRLSENPNFNVLLLESGESSLNLPFSQIPAAFSETFHSKYDYDLWTAEQNHADGKKRYWPRGKMLGGCSSNNAMICHHGAPSDYDEWAKIGGKGAEGWDYDHFKKYFLKFENFIPHSDYPNIDATLRGTSGPVQVGMFSNFTNFSAKFLTACVNVGIPPVHDLNTFRGSIGVCKPITYIDRQGVRVTTESAYLTGDVLCRPNLTILTHAQVTRVLFNVSKEEKRAVGVELVDSRKGKNGQRFTVKSRKEIVLSAGAIHTPQLLLLSGIGDTDHLASHTIPVIENLPGVGGHLMDHPVVLIQIRAKEGETLNHLNKRHGDGPLKPIRDMLRWKMGARGPLCSNVAETVAFLRSTDPKIFPPSVYRDLLDDTTSGPDAPDMELVGVPWGFVEHGHGVVPPGDVGCFGAICLRPTSTGRILLKSSNPFDEPYIDPKYLSTDHDLTILTRGLHLLLRLAQTEPISSLIGHDETDSRLDHYWNLDLSPSQQSTANPNHYSNHYINNLSKLQTEVKRRIETLYHPTCTARMAPREEGGVVDPSLRVYGVKGLRVCDASIFPTIPAGHTSAPVIAAAEKAADIIKNTYTSD